MPRFMARTPNLVINLESREELRRLVEVGTIQPNDKIREMPDGKWVLAAEHPTVADLWGDAPPPPPSAPPSPLSGELLSDEDILDVSQDAEVVEDYAAMPVHDLETDRTTIGPPPGSGPSIVFGASAQPARSVSSDDEIELDSMDIELEDEPVPAEPLSDLHEFPDSEPEVVQTADLAAIDLPDLPTYSNAASRSVSADSGPLDLSGILGSAEEVPEPEDAGPGAARLAAAVTPAAKPRPKKKKKKASAAVPAATAADRDGDDDEPVAAKAEPARREAPMVSSTPVATRSERARPVVTSAPAVQREPVALQPETLDAAGVDVPRETSRGVSAGFAAAVVVLLLVIAAAVVFVAVRPAPVGAPPAPTPPVASPARPDSEAVAADVLSISTTLATLRRAVDCESAVADRDRFEAAKPFTVAPHVGQSCQVTPRVGFDEDPGGFHLATFGDCDALRTGLVDDVARYERTLDARVGLSCGADGRPSLEPDDSDVLVGLSDRGTALPAVVQGIATGRIEASVDACFDEARARAVAAELRIQKLRCNVLDSPNASHAPLAELLSRASLGDRYQAYRSREGERAARLEQQGQAQRFDQEFLQAMRKSACGGGVELPLASQLSAAEAAAAECL